MGEEDLVELFICFVVDRAPLFSHVELFIAHFTQLFACHYSLSFILFAVEFHTIWLYCTLQIGQNVQFLTNFFQATSQCNQRHSRLQNIDSNCSERLLRFFCTCDRVFEYIIVAYELLSIIVLKNGLNTYECFFRYAFFEVETPPDAI